ncbi:RICIN domain-containing protein [Streptomyces lavendulae]|uniref:RICIN domain-containing protein n=1 Tax=Streptomyces lavendulae TaxID=1914 RepID=UPI0038187EE9
MIPQSSVECPFRRECSMRRRRLVLLSTFGAIFAASSTLSPSIANAAGPPTYIVNAQSGLTAFLVSPPNCHNMACLNGAPFKLGSGSDFSRFYTTKNAAGLVQFHWTSDKCVDVLNGGTANGTSVVVNDCNGSLGQLWFPAKISPGNYLFINGNGGGCLDADNSAFPNPPHAGARLQLWSCANSASAFIGNQTWQVDL